MMAIRHRFAVLLWDSKAKAADILGFVLAEHVPEAEIKAADRFPEYATNPAVFVRPAWREAPSYYGRTVRLRATQTSDAPPRQT